MNNVALITGINGQDGSYLAEFLLEKGYEVHGLVRRHSISVTSRIDHLIHSPYNNVKFFLHYADTTDSSGLMRLMAEIKPTEVYNLAAQSHVGISFEVPEYTADATGMSTFWRPFGSMGGRAAFIRRLPLSCSAGCRRRLPRVRKRLFIPRALMVWRSCILTGLR